MLKNYLKIAIRTLRKNPGYTFLNVFGLVLGFTCSLIIFLYVNNEFTYDKQHSNIENIYRLKCTYYLPKDAGQEDNSTMGAPVAQHMVEDYPEILQSVRFRRWENMTVERNDGTNFYETLFLADSNVFELFTFPLERGDASTALNRPYQVVLSKELAMKYFNTLDVVGESINMPDDSIILNVTGVLSDIPQNSHLRFDMLVSYETLYSESSPNAMGSWWSFSGWTYLEIDSKADIELLGEKIKRISANYILAQEEGSGYYQEYFLQRMDEIHLNSDLRGEVEPNSKASYVYIFLIVGIFILLIACINFMNLATARSANRAREIGVRKVSGAYRTQLVNQFLSESILISVISMILSLVLVVLLLPVVNDFTEKDLSLNFLTNTWLIPVIVLTTLFVGLASGSYPAFFLSGFKPVETLKGSFKSSSKGNRLRQILVISQFVIGIFLIAGTITVYKQLDFLRNKSLGFQKERIMFIPTRFTSNASRDFEVLKNEVVNLADVQSASLSSRVPGTDMNNNVVRLGWADDAEWSDMRFITVDYNFIELYELEIFAGRPFDEDITSDINEGFILNKSGMNRLGWTEPQDALGAELSWQNRNGRVIGILEDFHFMSVNQSIEPFIMLHNSQRQPGYLSVKMNTDNFQSTLEGIENAFKRIMPGKIFEYEFLDSDFDEQYRAEEKFMTIFSIFSIIAICVACLGLYGLAAFVAETKFKEIGIRKVLGASTSSILVLLNRDFTQLVAVSVLIATPAAYFAVDKWIASFPYKTDVSWWIFGIAAFTALLIAWFTVAYHSLKAARVNPVESISD